MISLNEVDKLLKSADGKEILTVKNHNTKDIINQVLEQHKSNKIEAKRIAYLFDGGNAYSTCLNIWNFLKYNVPYIVEPSDKQTTKTLSRILWDAKRGKGNDCKHYSSFTGAILDALGYKFKYRFTGYSDYIPTPTHVYCVCNENNKEIIIDAVLSGFDVQKPFKFKIDKNMSLYKLSGIDDTPQIGGLWDWAKKTVDRGFAYVNKNVPILKKVADVAGDVAQKVKDYAFTTTFAIPRAAIILLLRYNVKGWANGLKNQTYDQLEWWSKWFGGERPKLMDAIRDGAKKPRIMGFDNNEMLFPSQVGGIGEPVTITSALATATPILIKISTILDKAEKIANKAEGLANKATTTANTVSNAANKFKETTGVDVKDVIWKKDAGIEANKNSLSKDDLKPVDDVTAKKVALEITKQRAKATGVINKVDNKMLLIGGAAAVAAIIILSKKK